MKTLSLVRHAKSSWKYPGLDDADRPLNKRGIRDAPMMAERYAAEYSPDLLVTSFANRALTTARIFAGKLNYPVEQIRVSEKVYAAGADELLELVSSTEKHYQHVALFGHNPGLTLLCNQLCDATIENIPTLGIVVLEFDADTWSENSNGRLIMFDYPKKSIARQTGQDLTQ